MTGAARLAYLGPPGTNSEVAALRACPDAEHVPYASVGAVIHALERGEVGEAVAAIENSLQGSVTETVDLLIRDEGIAICGEVVLDIEHVGSTAVPDLAAKDIVDIVLAVGDPRREETYIPLSKPSDGST